MDAPHQGQSGHQQQPQQPSGRAEEDAAEEQPAGPTPAAVTITTAAAAAEEDTTPATAAAGQYDPREFQNPHPDAAATATAGSTSSKKTAKTKGGKATAKKGGGKGDADGEPCSNCGTLGASRKCSQCRQTQYCGEACFKVRERAHAGGRAVCGVQYIQHTSPV